MTNNQIKFTTATSNENLLTNSAVKAKMLECLGMSETDYLKLFVPNPVTGEIQGVSIGFDILFNADNQLSINGKIANDLMEQTAYSSGSISRVWNLSVATIGSGLIVFYFE